MDIRQFQTEITDRLGALVAAFSSVGVLLSAAGEIRIRTGLPLCIIGSRRGERYFISGHGRIVTSQSAYKPAKEEISRIFSCICRSSLYAYKDDIKNGFITLKGGHRVGIAGKMLSDGSVYDISSLNIRIARQVRGCAEEIIKYIIKDSRTIYSTLIISPPACGKTTVIRDIARILGTGSRVPHFTGANIGIIDERSEIAACYNGEASNDVGLMTDVYDACPKEKGILMMIRSMAPDIIITDEIGGTGDAAAVKSAMNAGVKLIATAHGSSISDLKVRNEIAEMIRSGVFERYITLSAKNGPGTIEEIIYNSSEVLK